MTIHLSSASSHDGKRYGFIYGEMMSPHIENEVTEGEIMGVMEVHITNY